MSSSKEIELILQAKLESSQAVSQAEAMGRAIVSQIENAIDNSRIGDKLIAQIQRAFGEGFNALNMGTGLGQTTNQGTNRPNTNTGPVEAPRPAPVAGTQAPNPQSTANTNPVNDVHVQSNNKAAQDAAQAAQRAAQSGLGAFLQPNAGAFSSIVNSLGGPYRDQLGQKAYGDAVGVDSLISRIRTGQYMSKINPNFDQNQLYTQDEIGEAQKKIQGIAGREADQIKSLNNQISRMANALEGNRDKVNNIKQSGARGEAVSAEDQSFLEKYERINNRLIEAIEKRKESESNLRDAKVADSQLKEAKASQASPWYATPRGVGMMAAAGVGLQVASDLRGNIDRYQTASAAIDNMDTRALSSGNFDKVLAMQALGGKDSIRNQGRFEAGTGILSSIASGAATGMASGGILGAIIGAPTGPGAAVSAGAGALIGALGGGLYGAYQGITGYGDKVQGSMEDQIAQHLAQNQELYEMTRTGRSAAMGSFRSAQAIGAPELSYFLTGGENISNLSGERKMLASQMSSLRSRVAGATNEEWQGNSKSIGGRVAGLRDQYSALEGRYDRITEREALAEMMNPYDETQKGRVTLREYAANRGVGKQFDQFAAGLGATMGGVFGDDRVPEVMKNGQAIAGLIDAQAAGLNGSAQISGGMFAGGMDRGEAMRVTASMFENAVAGGFDKATVGKAMIQMAQQASASLGGSYGAQASLSRAMNAAQATFGADGRVEESELNYTLKRQNYNQQMMAGGDSMYNIGANISLMKIQQDAKRDGVDLGNFNFSDYRTMKKLGATGSDQDILEYFQNKGGKDLTLEKIKPYAERFRNLANTASAEGSESLGDLMNLRDVENNAFGSMKEYNVGTSKANRDSLRDAKEAIDKKNDYDLKKDAANQTPTGKAETIIEDKVDADKITKGLSTLDANLGTLNSALEQLITRANTVLSNGFLLFGNPSAQAPGG